jgi:hypothetical protein
MMQSVPKPAKKCARCAALAERDKLRRVASQAPVAQKAVVVHSRRIQPRCSPNSTKTKMASSAKTNSWKWLKPFTNICGKAEREVQTVRDSKVADDQADLLEMHDPRDAGRQDPWGRVLKVAVARVAVSLAAPKAPNADT